MSQSLVINITTKDGASQAFRTIASSAKAMGTSLQSAGAGASTSLNKVATDAGKADQALDKLGASAEDAATGMDKLSDTATKVGAALGTGIAAISKFGAQAENQRRQVDGIRKAYGDAADQILDFTNAIQSSTKFSNEDAREAAQIAATLAQNYGFTADEVQKLITVSADLATIHGTSLADAVQRTSSAMRGEAESAEALGLTLNQQAIDRENVTLSMSNEEAAHFRLNALLEQSAYAQGAAGEAAQTAAGQAAQAANAFQDVTTNLGQALGPVAGVTAGFADLALVLPAVGAGAGKAIAALSKLAGMQGAATSVSALSTALATGGPLLAAIGTAAIVAAPAIIAVAAAAHQAAEAQATWNAEQAAGTQFLDRVGMSNVQTMRDLTDAFAQWNTVTTVTLGNTTIGLEDVNKMMLRLDETSAKALNHFVEGLGGPTADNIGQIAQEVVRLAEVERQASGYALGFADSQRASLQATFKVASAMDRATAAGEKYGTTQAGLARAAYEFDQGIDGQTARLNAQAEAIERANEAFLAPSMASGVGFGLGLDDNARAEIEAYGDQLDAAREAERALAEHTAELANSFLDQLVPGVDGASQAFANITRPGEDVLDTLQRIDPAVSSAGGSLLRLADGLQDAAQGLDGVLSTFAAIDALGQRSSQAGGIAENLVGSPGAWATIDDLLQQGVISLEEYNAALEAGYAIQTRDANIQQDLNSIRAQQLPLLAEQEAAYGAYISRLEQAGVAEQQQALYLMDSANQAKVAAAYSTAYSASLGEIPEDVATEIIAEASQADPILADILEKFGLIEVGADGNVSVNFEDATTLQDVTTSLDRLNNTQIQIAIAMADGELTADEILALKENVVDLDGETATVTVDADTDTARGEIGGASADVADLDGKSATVSVDATDNASGALDSANTELGEFDGKTVTATVNVETNFSTQAAKSPLTGADKPQDQTVTISIVADDQASGEISRVMQEASALASIDGAVTLTATDDASSVVARVMQAASALDSVDGAITLTADDQASTVVARAMQAANAFDGQDYNASLTVNDQTGGPIAQAMQAGNAFATTYTGTLAAVDGASSPIALAMQAGNAFATTYTGTLAVTDSASSPIAQAMAAGNAFATTYTASLQASDSASGAINSVANSLAALDGSTATVYINAVDNTGGATGKQLGGVIQIPHAANGRIVQVGEAGPENVVLPYGSVVQPHPATVSQQATPPKLIQDDKKYQKDLLPNVDMKKAYKKGGDSAKAFYDGLFAEAKRRVADQADELNSTVYGSKEEAEAAIADYKRFVKERDKAGKQREKGKDYDKEQKKAEKAASKAEQAFDDVATSAEKSGNKSGKSISKGVSDGSGVAEKAIGKLNKVLSDLGKVVSEPDVKANTTNADKGISGVNTDLTTLNGKSASVSVKVNDKAWQDFLDEVDTAQLGVTVVVKTKDKSSEGKMLGGVIQDHVPAAALGRVITVGEAGPEAVLLPYGSQVIPHPASAAQVQSQGVASLNIFGNVHVYPATSDVQRELQAQFTGIAR